MNLLKNKFEKGQLYFKEDRMYFLDDHLYEWIVVRRKFWQIWKPKSWVEKRIVA